MKFPYVRYDIFYRPVVPVIFYFKGKQFSYEMLLDTGADISLAHAELAQQLSVPIKKGKHIKVSGIAGKGAGYIHRLNVRIAGKMFNNVPIVLSKDIAAHSFGILGHEGIFNRIELVFRYNKKEFEIKT